MKLKIKKSSIEMSVIALFLLCDSRFFYLIPMPQIFGGSGNNRALAGIAGCVCTLILLFIENGKWNFSLYGKSIFLLYLFLIFQAIFERYKFNYNWSAIIFSILPFGIMLMYFSIIKVLRDKKIFECFLNIVMTIGAIVALLTFIQGIFYTHPFLQLIITIQGSSFKIFGPTGGLVFTASLISVYLFLKNRGIKKVVDLICYFVLVLGLSSSRVALLVVIIATIIEYFTISGIKKVSVGKVITTLTIGIAVMIVAMPVIQNLIGVWGDGTNGSYYARHDAINYYISVVPHYLFTGLGIVIPGEHSPLLFLVKGPRTIYNYDDIGIIGIYASMGILMTIWYIYIIVKNFLLSFSIKDVRLKGLCLSLSVAMVLLMSTMSYLDVQRVMGLLLTEVIIDRSRMLDGMEEAV